MIGIGGNGSLSGFATIRPSEAKALRQQFRIFLLIFLLFALCEGDDGGHNA